MAVCKSSGILILGVIQLHVPAAVPTGKEPNLFHWMWRWMGSIFFLDDSEKWKNCWPCGESKDSFFVQA